MTDDKPKRRVPRRQARYIYVIRLSKGVLRERRFVRANPNRDPGKKCVYVGLTGRSPEERFQQHKDGIKSARYVKKYGKNLLPSLGRKTYKSHKKALKLERELAERLRERGFGVWQK